MLMCGDLDGLLERVHNEQSFLVFIEALGAEFAQERTLTIPSSPTELEQVAGKTAPSIRFLKQLPLGQSAVTGAPPNSSRIISNGRRARLSRHHSGGLLE